MHWSSRNNSVIPEGNSIRPLSQKFDRKLGSDLHQLFSHWIILFMEYAQARIPSFPTTKSQPASHNETRVAAVRAMLHYCIGNISKEGYHGNNNNTTSSTNCKNSCRPTLDAIWIVTTTSLLYYCIKRGTYFGGMCHRKTKKRSVIAF